MIWKNTEKIITGRNGVFLDWEDQVKKREYDFRTCKKLSAI